MRYEPQTERRRRLLPVDPPVGVVSSVGVQGDLVGNVGLGLGGVVMPPTKERKHDALLDQVVVSQDNLNSKLHHAASNTLLESLNVIN